MIKPIYRMALATALSATLGFSAVASAQPPERDRTPRKFTFALIGDQQYDAAQEAAFPNLIKDINQANVSFVVHDGDLKSGSSLCSDETFVQRRDQFNTFAAPFVFIFGDNEWTDCHRANNGSFDPIERLAKLREIFTADDFSQGQRKLKLDRQSNNPEYSLYRENVRWVKGGVVFVGFNLPGSNNNLGREAAADAEYAARNAANLVWLKEAFELAKEINSPGVMLIIQANPNFELPATDPDRSGFNDFLAALEVETIAYGKPVVLVHGDSHNFQINKPLFSSKTRRRLENFTRVETFGSPDVHWVRATVDLRNPQVFEFSQMIVKKNLINHK
jgi:Calcineurin-like phosphoesterase